MKKILIGFIILIFCIGFVSASENVSDIQTVNDVNILSDDSPSEVSKIYVNSSKQSIGNGTSWDDAYNGSVSWNEIHYDNSTKIDNCIVYLADGEYSQNNSIHYDNCTFIGQGKNTVISFFADNVNSNSKCVFINITFVKNESHDSVATLRANYDFINCTFIDLTMVKVGWPTQTSACFTNCLFTDYYQTDVFMNNYYGNLKFDNCIFENIKSNSIVYNDACACTILDNCVFRNCSIKGILKSDDGYLWGSRIKNAHYDKFINKSPYHTPFYFNSTDNLEIYVNESREFSGDGSSWENATNTLEVYDGLTVYLAEGNYFIPNKMVNVTYKGSGDKTIIKSFNLNGDGYYTIRNNLVTVINATFMPDLRSMYIGRDFSYNINVDGMNYHFIDCKFINSTFVSRTYNKLTPDRDGLSQTCSIVFDNCILKDYNGSYLINNWEYSKFVFNNCIFDNISADAIVDSYGGQIGTNGISDGIFIYNSIFKKCILNGVVKVRNIGSCEIAGCTYDFDAGINKIFVSPFYINKTDITLNKTKLTVNIKDNNIIISLIDVDANKPIVDVEVAVINNDRVYGYYGTDNNGQIILSNLVGTFNFEFSYPGDPYAYHPTSLNKTFTFKPKINTLLTVKNINTVYNTAKKWTFTLKDVNNNVLANKKVTVKLDKNYEVTTNNNGQAILTLPANLVPKTYAATINFAGDNNYNKVSTTAKVIVAKATPKLTTKKLTTKVKVKTKKVTATLKGVPKNTKITLKLKGKTYTAKTNKKGIATFKVTKLNKKGTFKGTVKFAGNKYFKAVSKSVQIKVK